MLNFVMNSLPIDILALKSVTGFGYPEPVASRMGDAAWRALGDHFGLSQLGASHETLQPGAQSSVCHWHTTTDELVVMLSGELVLRPDGEEHIMRAGQCVGFKAGASRGHHLVNRSSQEATFIVVGTRLQGDSAHYPEDDLAMLRDDSGRHWVHKSGTPYPGV